ncbi:salicyl-AMP ligase [Burkholderia oklahomensis EO147]|nr:salicyl-AMP ligase [Burkholderia oklahomensis EO147]AOI50275.1 salicyl-AMP ligase [Burkholderia oklahomensis C6786]KUY62214.1 salicyl-AMP ligase [Burkholderia oklahomensis C6786]KUY67634.1 salicyl-AMP ligase [Burkholderia oklahomensis EO147]
MRGEHLQLLGHVAIARRAGLFERKRARAAPASLALKRHLRDQGLAAFKIPDRIEFVPRFPETGIGKTSKKSLRDLLRRQLAAASA